MTYQSTMHRQIRGNSAACLSQAEVEPDNHRSPEPKRPPSWRDQIIEALGAERASDVFAESRRAEAERRREFEVELLASLSWEESNLLWGHVALAPAKQPEPEIHPCFVEAGL